MENQLGKGNLLGIIILGLLLGIFQFNSLNMITTFKVSGVLLVIYSMGVFAAWIYDINKHPNTKLLGILTFGRAEAAERLNIAITKTSKKYYFTFEEIIIRCGTILAIGLIILIIDKTPVITMMHEGIEKVINYLTFYS